MVYCAGRNSSEKPSNRSEQVPVIFLGALLVVVAGCSNRNPHREEIECRQVLIDFYDLLANRIASDRGAKDKLILLPENTHRELSCPAGSSHASFRVAPFVTREKILDARDSALPEVIVCHCMEALHGSAQNRAGILLSNGDLLYVNVETSRYAKWLESLPADEPWLCPREFLTP